MNSVLIIIPQDSKPEDIIKALQTVINSLENTSLYKPGFQLFNTNPKVERMVIFCKNLISKLGYPSTNNIAWASSFFQSYYNLADDTITQEVIEYIANAGQEEHEVMETYGLSFLIDICQGMCKRN